MIKLNKNMNEDLRAKIVEMVKNSGEGHIPSSFSIVDIIDYLYGNVLKFNIKKPNCNKRDFFILSKGHGCGALYAVLHKYKFLKDRDLKNYSKKNGILGGHPDKTKVPGVEASTGSLGHGFPMSVGIAMGLKIKKKLNKVFVLLGDGECHEGTIWESANIAANQQLGNLCAIIDWNESAKQLMPIDDLPAKWKSFGWNVMVIDGHSLNEIKKTFKKIKMSLDAKPNVIVARNIKGKGVSFIEGHGKWHHKIPNDHEYDMILKELSK